MRQLLAVRRYGSFAKAADALGMSQPSLSAAITRLEDQLKVRLFDRTASGSVLTPIGELIAERAGKVVAEAEQIVHEAGLIAGGEAGVVRLGVGNSLRQGFLPNFVRVIAQNHPALCLEIQVLDRDRLAPMLRSRDLDLVICALGEDLEGEDLLTTEVLTTTAVVVAHPDHPLTAERNVSIDKLADYPGAGPGLREFTNSRLTPGEERPFSRYQSNDYDALIQLALDGRATLVAPAFLVKPYLDKGALKRIDIDLNFRVSFAAIATRAASYSPVISRIVRYACALGAEIQA